MAMFKPLHTRRRRLVFSSSSHIRTKRGQESEIQFEKKKRLIIFTIFFNKNYFYLIISKAFKVAPTIGGASEFENK